jgi:hypothetical protein
MGQDFNFKKLAFIKLNKLQYFGCNNAEKDFKYFKIKAIFKTALKYSTEL